MNLRAIRPQEKSVKVERSQVAKLRITDVDGLDPIDLFIDEVSATSGAITVNCFGQSWTAFWPAVGERGIVEFFKSCDNEYIIGYLDSDINRHTEDWDAYKEMLKSNCKEFGGEHQEAILDAIEDMDEERLAFELEMAHEDDFDCLDILMDSGELQYAVDVLPDDLEIESLFKPDDKIPRKEHHKYAYLSKIVNAVKQAL